MFLSKFITDTRATICLVWFFTLLFMLSSCGHEDDDFQGDLPATGAIVFSLTTGSGLADGHVRHARALSNCSDVANVTADVFDQSDTLLKQGGAIDAPVDVERVRALADAIGSLRSEE